MEDVETCASTAGGQAVNWSSAREEMNESNRVAKAAFAKHCGMYCLGRMLLAAREAARDTKQCLMLGVDAALRASGDGKTEG